MKQTLAFFILIATPSLAADTRALPGSTILFEKSTVNLLLKLKAPGAASFTTIATTAGNRLIVEEGVDYKVSVKAAGGTASYHFGFVSNGDSFIITGHSSFSVAAMEATPSTTTEWARSVLARESIYMTPGNQAGSASGCDEGGTQNLASSGACTLTWQFRMPYPHKCGVGVAAKAFRIKCFENDGGDARCMNGMTFVVDCQKSSAKGDPHVTNIRGEKFDLLKSGSRVLVQYPRESSDPSLLVKAQIARADAKWCENTFIEKVQAHGSMLGTSVSFNMGKLRSPGPFRVTIGEKTMSLSAVIKEKQVSLPAPRSYISGDTRQMTLTLSQGVSMQVQLVKHAHFQFFNLDVSGLSNLPGEVGGLLGMDDHSGEAHEDCKFKTHKTMLKDVDDSSDLASIVTAA